MVYQLYNQPKVYLHRLNINSLPAHSKPSLVNSTAAVAPISENTANSTDSLSDDSEHYNEEETAEASK